MSFCADVKNEIAAVKWKACCKKAGVMGMLLFSAEFSQSGFRTVTESETVCKKLCADIRSVFGFSPSVKESPRKNGSLFIITENDSEKMKHIFNCLYPNIEQKSGINHMIMQNECCRAAFLRGAFLTGGTVTDPQKSYYLDFTTHSAKLASELKVFLSEEELEASEVLRRGTRVVYFRGSEKIESVLKSLGAFQCYFDFLNAKIEKGVRNDVNRTLNCDAGNTKKSLQAAKKQLEAVKYIKKSGRFGSLPEELKAVAAARLENEDVPLSELGNLCEPKLSKTAVYNRLAKITALAAELKGGAK